MKKYTLTNYAETNATASSSTTDSGIIDSGFIDSGFVDSGIVDSGVVDPDDEEDPDDESTWDYGTYTEEEMEQMMKDGTWNGGYVNGVYVMPTVDVYPDNGGGGENTNGGYTGGGYTGGGYTGGGHTGGGHTDGENTNEQNNPVPSPDEQTTNGDSTQSGTQGGEGTPDFSTEETNQTTTIENTSDDSIVQYDVIDKSGFLSQKGKTGCRKACQDMQIKAGYTSSNSQYIPMTVNMNDKPIAVHERFQEGKEYIDSELARGRAVIVGVDYKAVNELPNLDKGSDHFVLIVGKYPGIGSEYYHYFDPRTQSIEKGTRSENVLLIENGYLVGDFEDYPGKVLHYVVTRVNYNEDL